MESYDKERLLSLPIDLKVEHSKNIIGQALTEFGRESLALAITGGKDSTTNLWIFKQVCAELGIELPLCMFIDEGDVFDEINEFVSQLKNSWSIKIAYIKNEDVISQAQGIGDLISVSALNEINRKALEEIGFSDAAFPFLPDSTICNHLLKTVPMREFIKDNKVKGLVTAIRWDEQTARLEEDFFSPRTNPDHMRIHPILHFTERDIWIAIFKYDIPFNKLYKLGYRSLGARCATRKNADIPAWMQDLENTLERSARGQDKEEVMDQLRALGYM